MLALAMLWYVYLILGLTIGTHRFCHRASSGENCHRPSIHSGKYSLKHLTRIVFLMLVLRRSWECVSLLAG